MFELNAVIWKYLKATKVFIFTRFVFSLLLLVLYLICASMLQYIFVLVLGRTSFNYIVFGFVSLLISMIIFSYANKFVMLLIRGWHVSSLAYVSKIVKNNLSALDVGMCAFNKNFPSFGLVIALYSIIKSTVVSFYDKFYVLLGNTISMSNMKTHANSPIVEYIAKNILGYAYDMIVFYIIKHPISNYEESSELFQQLIKKYFCSVPDIIQENFKGIICCNFVSLCAKVFLVIYLFLSKGILLGLLLTFIMYPVFKLLDNVFVDSFMLLMFTKTFSEVCDKDYTESPIMEAINKVLDEEYFDEDVEETKQETVEVDENNKYINIDSEAEDKTDNSLVHKEDLVSFSEEDLSNINNSLQSSENSIEDLINSLNDDLSGSNEFTFEDDTPELNFVSKEEETEEEKPVSIAEMFQMYSDIDLESMDDGEDEVLDRAQNMLMGDD